MKNSVLLCIIVLTTLYLSGQTYTSVNDGNWTSPTTWNPTGVPVTFSEVIINHNVLLNTDFSYSTGTITINNGGSLIHDVTPRYLAINGGILDNDGTLEIYGIAIYSGEFNNNNTCLIDQLYNNGNLNNYGIIDQVDSLLNEHEIDNSEGEIYADRFYNDYYLGNYGIIEGSDFFNAATFDNDSILDYTNFYNADSAFNSGEIYFNDHTNSGYCENYGDMVGTEDFTNSGDFENYSYFSVDNDFSNVDSTYYDALFYNEGLVVVGNNWFNADSIDGTSTGQFCIANETGNNGEMYGNFDFCDQTPPGTSPFIDYNTGYVDPNITYCQTPCGTGKVAIAKQNVSIYPNPARDFLSIENTNEYNLIFRLFDITGQLIYDVEIDRNQQIISLENISKSIYVYQFITKGGNNIKSGKLIIE